MKTRKRRNLEVSAVATVRNPSPKHSRVSLTKGICQFMPSTGMLTVLVNNAGYSLMGALEDILMDGLKAQFETNLFGPARVMKSVLPKMRKQNSDRIADYNWNLDPLRLFLRTARRRWPQKEIIP